MLNQRNRTSGPAAVVLMPGPGGLGVSVRGDSEVPASGRGGGRAVRENRHPISGGDGAAGGGIEIACGSLFLLVVGGGRWSVDARLSGGRERGAGVEG